MRWTVLACASGCAADGLDPDELDAGTEATSELQLEVAPPGGDYGDLRDGASLWCAIPPQGGAPYSPLLLRLYGPDELLAEGVAIEAIAADANTSEPLVYTALTLQLLLSNVGESAGGWVGPEVHIRYDGWTLEALSGRTAALVVRATALADPSVTGLAQAEVELSPE